MAALSIGLLCHHFKLNQRLNLTTTRSTHSKLFVSCQNRDPDDPLNTKNDKEAKGLMLHRILGGVEKLGKGLKDSLSPKQKGDWKDIALMSLSFAVYVYMSQKIVCAYCAWMSMARQPW